MSLPEVLFEAPAQSFDYTRHPKHAYYCISWDNMWIRWFYSYSLTEKDYMQKSCIKELDLLSCIKKVIGING